MGTEMSNQPPSIGFIGAGVMGRSMIGHLLKAGHAMRIHTRTRAKAEPLLAAGAVSLGAVDVQASELKKHRDRAREMALLAAREKAEKMAAVLGEKLGGYGQASKPLRGKNG